MTGSYDAAAVAILLRTGAAAQANSNVGSYVNLNMNSNHLKQPRTALPATNAHRDDTTLAATTGRSLSGLRKPQRVPR